MCVCYGNDYEDGDVVCCYLLVAAYLLLIYDLCLLSISYLLNIKFVVEDKQDNLLHNFVFDSVLSNVVVISFALAFPLRSCNPN